MKKIEVDNDLERNPKIRKMLDELAKGMVSIREATLAIYRTTLTLRIPDWSKQLKNAESNAELLDNVALMENDLKTCLAKRGVSRVTSAGYMEGCYEEILLGVQDGSRRSLPRYKRKEALALVQKGEDPEVARKLVRSKKQQSLVPVVYFSFRPPNRGEQARTYLAQAKKAWATFLKDNGINAIVEMTPMRQTKPIDKPAGKRTWVNP
jgi:hypothetical protein